MNDPVQYGADVILRHVNTDPQVPERWLGPHYSGPASRFPTIAHGGIAVLKLFNANNLTGSINSDATIMIQTTEEDMDSHIWMCASFSSQYLYYTASQDQDTRWIISKKNGGGGDIRYGDQIHLLNVSWGKKYGFVPEISGNNTLLHQSKEQDAMNFYVFALPRPA